MATGKNTAKGSAASAKGKSAKSAEGPGSGPHNPNSENQDSIEDLIANIDEIVARLEDESAPLDTAIKDFESGMALTRKAQTLLDNAEQRVQTLLAEDGEALSDSADMADDTWADE